MRLALAAGLTLSALLAGSALAQTAPTSAPAAAAPPVAAAPSAAAAPAAAAPAAKPKKRGPTPASAVVVTNASKNTATDVTITGEGKDAKLTKALKPMAKASVKLPKLKGCIVTVAATFEGEGHVDAGEFDVCKDKTIRFTD